jgi:PAS domain-containing protein
MITAEKKLTESVERLERITAQLHEKTLEQQAMLDAFSDLVFRMASDSTILDYKASNLHSQLYIPPEVFLGQKMVELVPLLAEQTQQAIAFVLETQSMVTMEYSLPMFKGEEYYQARFLPFEAQQVMLILRNVTNRKQCELQLQRIAPA